MEAKPGRPRTQLAIATIDYVPPDPPFRLTKSQHREWGEITTNPLLSRVDDSLLVDYINTVAVRDKALQAVKKHGLLMPGAKGDLKSNPAWRVYRDCQDHLLKLRQVMLLTPRARAELRASGLLEPPAAEDEIEID